MSSAKANVRPYQFVLASACLLLILSFGYRAGFGLFMVPMTEARGWGRDVLAMALAIQNLSWGICAILAGALADKYGNLRVLLSGVFLYAIGMMGMSISATEVHIISTAGLLVGAGVAGTSFGIVLPSIARAVPEEKRAWAMGIGTAAGSFGQFLVVPIIQTVVDSVGWMSSLQYLGLSAFLMAIFCIPLAKYGGASEAQSGEAQAPVSITEIARRACAVRSYQLLIFGFFVCGFHVAFITVHMPGYVIDLGFDPQVGAWSISLIGLCNVIGAYYSGVLSGKRSMRALLTCIYLGRVLAISLFLVMPVTLTSIMIFSAGMGFLWL
ncbi:MAG TPA: MFS transporter, partial [Gammaproteobacteria bacterium]|nr:MFS transporter [Gammaproteobacteria bacterium]